MRHGAAGVVGDLKSATSTTITTPSSSTALDVGFFHSNDSNYDGIYILIRSRQLTQKSKMFPPLPTPILTLLFALPAFSYASPQPALITDDYMMSLVPRHTLFLRQLSNLQTFDSALGGASASAITNSGDAERPFSVDGQTFDSFDAAAQRSCDNQFQACQGAANGNGNNGNGGNQANTNNGGNNRNGNNNNNNGGNNRNQNQNQNQGNGNRNRGRGMVEVNETGLDVEMEFGLERRQLTVNQCDQQKGMFYWKKTCLCIMEGLLMIVTDQCKSAQQSAQVKDFQTAVASTNIGPDPLFPDFDLICEG